MKITNYKSQSSCLKKRQEPSIPNYKFQTRRAAVMNAATEDRGHKTDGLGEVRENPLLRGVTAKQSGCVAFV